MRGSLQFLFAVRLNVAPVQKWAELPTVDAVIHLHRRLTLKLQFQTHLVGALQFHEKRKLRLFGWPARKGIRELLTVWHGQGEDSSLIASSAHFPLQRQGLDCPPRLQAAPGGHVLVYDLSRG